MKFALTGAKPDKNQLLKDWVNAGNLVENKDTLWKNLDTMTDMGLLGEDYRDLARGDYAGFALMATHEQAMKPPRTIPEQVIDLLKSCDIPESKYKTDLDNITNACTALGRMLS